MDLHIPPPELIPFGLRAMRMIALANGSFDSSERSLIATAQKFLGTSYDLEALEPIEPAELAEHITDPKLRKQLVRGMTVITLVDGEASPEEVALVEAYAAALEIDTRTVATLRRLSEGRMLMARFDIGRRFWARKKIQEYARDKGILWLARAVAALLSLKEDKATASRFRGLGDCPEGSLGRAYFDFITSNEFSFPGEKGSPPEVIALHDLTHVLSGYGTDPAGEMQVLAFHAGCREEQHDPFSYILFGLAQFHMGIQISPVAEGVKGSFEPNRMLLALRRGVACNIDPTEGWDAWPLMAEPLEALRERYGIQPL